MRKLLLLPLVAAILFPTASLAEWGPALRPEKKGVRGPSARAVPARDLRAPAPPRGPAPREAPRPPPRVAYDGWGYVLGVDAVPFWLGWSWGWGYYPLYPRPSYPGYEPGYLPDDAHRITARLEAYGAGASHAAAGTLAMSMEGPFGGFNADVVGLALPGTSGTATGDTTLTLGGARATWSFLSDASGRLRLEVGGAMLSVPGTGAWTGTTYADTLSFGPQAGLSGHLALLGPVGLEGHARVMPWPVPVFDARAALVLRGGPFAVSAGWRAIDVNGDGRETPEAHFAGPEIGLQLTF
jgi:hypothetical protein